MAWLPSGVQLFRGNGLHVGTLRGYRKALPRVSCGIDLKVPEEASIFQSIGKLSKAPPKYVGLYNLLLDSGLRLVDAVKVVSKLDTVERLNGFCRIALGEFMGSKQAYYAYLSEATYNQLLSFRADLLSAKPASRYYKKMSYIQPKYLRKFAFDKMVELEVPESVADFIEGRVPKRIGAKNYIWC